MMRIDLLMRRQLQGIQDADAHYNSLIFRLFESLLRLQGASMLQRTKRGLTCIARVPTMGLCSAANVELILGRSVRPMAGTATWQHTCPDPCRVHTLNGKDAACIRLLSN